VAKAGKDTLEYKSPAEFFAENKNIAGFDNVRQRHHLCLVLANASAQGLDSKMHCAMRSLANACTPPSGSSWKTLWTQRRASASCRTSMSQCADHEITVSPRSLHAFYCPRCVLSSQQLLDAERR